MESTLKQDLHHGNVLSHKANRGWPLYGEYLLYDSGRCNINVTRYGLRIHICTAFMIRKSFYTDIHYLFTGYSFFESSDETVLGACSWKLLYIHRHLLMLTAALALYI